MGGVKKLLCGFQKALQCDCSHRCPSERERGLNLFFGWTFRRHLLFLLLQHLGAECSAIDLFCGPYLLLCIPIPPEGVADRTCAPTNSSLGL